MRQGAELFADLQKTCAEAGKEDGRLVSWMLSLGDAARAVITRPMLRGVRLIEWRVVPQGATVSALDDENELKQLCERCPDGAQKEVGWNPGMLGYAGKVCVVQRTRDIAYKSYDLRCVKLPSA